MPRGGFRVKRTAFWSVSRALARVRDCRAGWRRPSALTQLEDKLHAEFAVADWPLADLAARFGAQVDAFEGLPANADATLDFATSPPASARWPSTLSMGEGHMPFAGGLDVQGLDVTATYLANDDTMRVDVTGDKVGPASGQASLTLKNILQGQSAHEFELIE
jgi:hypothetical protein